MARQTLLIVSTIAGIALLAGAYFAFYGPGSGTACVVTSYGGFEFRVLSDSTGAPVNGETITAVNRLGCNGQTQVVNIDKFSESQGGGGWLVPDFPSGATPAGQLTFTITYQGTTNTFTTGIPPVGTNCVTFHVPSGSMNSTTATNGNGSYC